MRALGICRADLAELSAEVLGQGGTFCFRAHGASMLPFIRDGDLLTVRPSGATTLRVGDVALYCAGGDRLAAHRIVGRDVEEDQLVLIARGDATRGPGERVGTEQVLGRVVLLQRGASTVDLDHGPRRLAARLWMLSAPLGPWFLHGACRLKQLLA